MEFEGLTETGDLKIIEYQEELDKATEQFQIATGEIIALQKENTQTRTTEIIANIVVNVESQLDEYNKKSYIAREPHINKKNPSPIDQISLNNSFMRMLITNISAISISTNIINEALKHQDEPETIADAIIEGLWSRTKLNHLQVQRQTERLWDWITNNIREAPTTIDKFVDYLHIARDYLSQKMTQVDYAKSIGIKDAKTLRTCLKCYEAIKTLAEAKQGKKGEF